jgi:hypothetical protein
VNSISVALVVIAFFVWAFCFAGCLMCGVIYLKRRKATTKSNRTNGDENSTEARQWPRPQGDGIRELGTDGGRTELLGSVRHAVELSADARSRMSGESNVSIECRKNTRGFI